MNGMRQSIARFWSLECFREKCERISRQEARQNKGLGSFIDSIKTGTTLAVVGVLASGLGAPPGAALGQTAGTDRGQRTATGLPLPRFASLKVDRVNLRQGPGTDYPTAWVFQRAGLPVEILREFEGWRQIRDADGTTGWVQGAALSGRRMALIAPWDSKAAVTAAPNALRGDPRDDAGAIAYLEPNVVTAITNCDGRWCRVAIGEIRGFIEQPRLWGVYPGEMIK